MLTNPWVGYVQRSYQQIKDRVITDLASRVPEITDHTESNLYIKIISIVSGLVEMLGYYVDNAAREAYLSVNRLFSSAVNIANLLDYNVKISSSAYVDLTFTLENITLTDVTIPQYTEVSGSAYDFTFITNEVLVIPAGSLEGVVGARQRKSVTSVNIGTSDGSINQRVVLDITNIDLDTVVATIDGDTWTGLDSLAYSSSIDKNFVISVDEDVNIYLLFGDDINGAVPLNGADIVINYFETVGSEGNNVSNNTLDTIDTAVTIPVEGGELSVTNTLAAAGGTDIESLARLKSRIPKSLRTLSRAITELDYKDIADLYVGVLKSTVNHECGNPTDIYVVPVGGGTSPQSLLDAIEVFFEDKKAINMLVRAKSAGQLNVDINLDVTTLSNYQNVAIQTSVTEALNTLLSWENSEIGGDVFLSNLYQAVEAVEGVKNSKFNSIILNSAPTALSPVTSTIQITVVPNSTTEVTYTYIAIFTSAAQFQLIRDGILIGTYDSDIPIVLSEGTITISGVYVAGESWEFYLYGNILKTGSTTINEFSVPIANSTIVNVTGGY